MTQNRKVAKKLVVFIIVIGIGLCCLATFTFSWYAGYLKKPVCLIVTQDSEIYKTLNCEENNIVPNTDDINDETSEVKSINIDQEAGNTDLNVIDIVERNSPAVVGIAIDVENDETETIIGSSFLISDDGLLVTNRHVVEGYTGNYYVVFKGGKQSILIDNDNIFKDPINDIAIIKIDKNEIPDGVMPIMLGDSDNIKLGESVVAIGNSLGEFTGTVTKGIVSGLNREVSISKGFFDSSNQVFQGVIQTDAAINPGNSGGPLLDLKGRVIGINFATIEGASNLSFALPINWVKERIAEVEKFGKFRVPFVGIEFRNKIMFIKDQSFLGAEILNVVEASPASSSGLQKGDIIVSFDNRSLDENNLVEMIQKQEIGSQVNIIVFRHGKQLQLEILIGEK